MPQEHRLSRADFAHMRAFRRVNGSLFSFLYGYLPDRGLPSGACVVSKKVAPHAVDRNRLRRRVRPSLLAVLRSLDTPLSIVCHAKKSALGASYEQINEEVKTMAQRIIKMGS